MLNLTLEPLSSTLIQLRSCLDGASVLGVVFEADTIMDKESGKRCIFILHFWLFPALYSPITDKEAQEAASMDAAI